MRNMKAPGKAALAIALIAASALGVAAAQQGPTCFGKAATKVGSAGNNVIRGTKGPDVIVTKEGDDTVYGLGGKDRICTGKGSDNLYGGDGLDRLGGEKGGDDLFGGKGNDRL